MAHRANLPLFPLDLVLMPGEVLPLHIFEPRYRAMISEADSARSEFGIVRQTGDSLERIGCAAKVREVTKRFQDGRFHIDAIGTRRFVAHSFDSSQECVHAAVEFFGDDTPVQADAAKVQARRPGPCQLGTESSLAELPHRGGPAGRQGNEAGPD